MARFPIRTFLSALACCLLLDGAAAAEEQVGVTAASEAESKDDAIEVVVTASRGLEQKKLDIPQAVVTVPEEVFQSGQYTDIDDAIREFPNIGMAPSEGNPNYWQEGFSIRGLGSQRVLTLTNGIRQSGQGIGYGGGNLNLYDTFSIERIEILKGPASVLYGTDAFGGVINIITREPKRRDAFGANGSVSYNYDGSRDLNHYGAYVDVGDEAYGLVAGGSFLESGEPNLPDDVDPQGGSYNQRAFWGKLDLHLSEKTDLRIIGDLVKTGDILVLDSSITLPIAMFPPPGAMAPVTSPLFFEFPKYDRSMFGAELTTEDLAENWTFAKTGLYWQRTARNFHRESAYYSAGSPGFAGPPLFVDPTATVTASVVDTDDEVNTYEWLSQARYEQDNHQVTVGFDFGYDTSELPESEVQTVAGIAGIGPVLGPSTMTSRVRADAQQYRAGLFAQDIIDLAPLSVIPGLRLDYISAKDSESDLDDSLFGVSGSLGVVDKLSEEWSLYTTLASGFRAPDLNERFQDTVVNLGAPNRVIGKADLDPERAWGAELGTKYEGAVVRGELAGFYNYIEDFIGREGIGIIEGIATEQYNNVGNVSLYGPEVTVGYDVVDWLEVFANAGRVFTDDDDKVDVPDWAFNYGVRFHQPIDELHVKNASATIQARSMLDSEQETVVPGRQPFPEDNNFTVVDVLFGLELGDTPYGSAMVNAGVRNVFDEEYYEPFFPLYQPGRSAFVGVELRF